MFSLFFLFNTFSICCFFLFSLMLLPLLLLLLLFCFFILLFISINWLWHRNMFHNHEQSSSGHKNVTNARKSSRLKTIVGAWNANTCSWYLHSHSHCVEKMCRSFKLILLLNKYRISYVGVGCYFDHDWLKGLYIHVLNSTYEPIYLLGCSIFVQFPKHSLDFCISNRQ